MFLCRSHFPELTKTLLAFTVLHCLDVMAAFGAFSFYVRIRIRTYFIRYVEYISVLLLRTFKRAYYLV